MSKPYLTYSEYCHNRTMRVNSGGTSNFFHLPDGRKLTEAEMDAQYPIKKKLKPSNVRHKGENADKTSIE